MNKNVILVSLALLFLAASCSLLGGDETGAQTPEEIRQWAVSASSETYIFDTGNRDDQSPFAATGEPDVAECGDSMNAWTPDQEDDGLRWLEVTFYDELHVTKVRVRESWNPGSIVKIELMDNGEYTTYWEGKDMRRHPECPGFFEAEKTFPKGNITIPMTPFKTDTVRITFDTDDPDPEGWNEIDAVELVGYDKVWYVFNNTIWIE